MSPVLGPVRPAASEASVPIRIRSFDAPLGAEVVGLDLSQPLSEARFARIVRAHLDHHVLVFRDQRITPDRQIAFSRRFGPLQIHVLHQFQLQGHPEILVVSNIEENGPPIGLGDAGHYWHSDLFDRAFRLRSRTRTERLPPMRIATWNVNSLKIRLPHVLDWLARHPVDVLALQETKLVDDKFPVAELEAAGYRAAFTGQKTYNGVAILSRIESPATDVVFDIPGFEDDQKRVVSATVGGVRVVCVYVPNGQSVGTDKYAYKLRWMEALRALLTGELAAHPRLVVGGDYNVAPEDRDVHDPKAWEGQVLFSEPEKAALKAIASIGLHDAFRLFEQPPKSFSWWDYRMLGFQKGRGLRIDHLLVSDAMKVACTACTIDRDERKKPQPSDHAPVVATFDLS